MVIIHTLTTTASFLGVEEMSRVLFDLTLPILNLSKTIKDLKIENYSLCSGCCYLVFSSLRGSNCTGLTQIVTQLAVIFSTFGRNCDTLSISFRELKSQHTIIKFTRSRRAELVKLQSTCRRYHISQSDCVTAVCIRANFHDNFGFNKDFLSHSK